jgi:hypothetical protein
MTYSQKHIDTFHKWQRVGSLELTDQEVGILAAEDRDLGVHVVRERTKAANNATARYREAERREADAEHRGTAKGGGMKREVMETLGKDLAASTKEYVANAVAPLLARIEALEAANGEKNLRIRHLETASTADALRLRALEDMSDVRTH